MSIVTQLALAIRASSAYRAARQHSGAGRRARCNRRTRQRERVILKTLGATRSTLLQGDAGRIRCSWRHCRGFRADLRGSRGVICGDRGS